MPRVKLCERCEKRPAVLWGKPARWYCRRCHIEAGHGDPAERA